MSPEGGITTLLGPSGAGKTVTVKLVVGLLKPDSGVVSVEGRELNEMAQLVEQHRVQFLEAWDEHLGES